MYENYSARCSIIQHYKTNHLDQPSLSATFPLIMSPHLTVYVRCFVFLNKTTRIPLSVYMYSYIRVKYYNTSAV